MPVGGRLQKFWKRWKRLGASSFIVAMLRYGLTLNWKTESPKLSYDPVVISFSPDQKRMDLMRSHVKELLEKNAIEIVPDKTPGFFSRVFMVPKIGTKKWRPVIDLSKLNNFVDCPHFKMETSESIRESLDPIEFVSSIDLSDAYFHIPVHKSFRKYFMFNIDQVTYQFCAMPFGLNIAPRDFTSVADQFRKIAMLLGFRLNQFLDDWLNRNSSYELGRKSIFLLLQLIIYLGFIPNFEKSMLEPSNVFDFLGTHYDLQTQNVRPTDKRITKLVQITQSFLTSQSQSKPASARKFMSLIGMCNSAFRLVEPIGRLHIRPFQWYLAKNWNESKSYDIPIHIHKSLHCHLSWWGCLHNLMVGDDLHPPSAQVQLVSDASLQGWGAHCMGEEVQGVWSSLESKFHINVLELKAIFLAIEHFKLLLKGKIVLILCDNSTAVSYLKNLGGLRSWQLYALVWRICTKAKRLGISLRIRHIPGSLNVIADRLSRKNQVLQTEWSLHPEVFQTICKVKDTPLIDVFATVANRKLPVFISPVPDPMAYAVDALSVDWTCMHIYAYPPTTLLGRVVKKIQKQQCRVLLIAPLWPGQVWFWDLVHLSISRPLKLPERDDLLKQPSGTLGCKSVFADNMRMRNLHVWELESRIDMSRPKSNWLLDFEKRKSITPFVYCTKFTGSDFFSTSEKMSIWLDVEELYRQ